MRYELVQVGIKQTDVDGQSVHSLQDSVEVLGLVGEQLGKCLLTTLLVLSQDHLTHSLDLLTLKEHVLGTAKTDTNGTECAGYLSIVRSIGVGAYNQTCVLVAQVHQLSEVAADLGSLGLNLTLEYLTGRTVD